MEKFEKEVVKKLEVYQTKEYYNNLREKCMLVKNKQLKVGQGLIKTFYPLLRPYKLEIYGEENVPKDSNALFVVNHSNSHDIFTAYEVLSKLRRHGSVMVATDCLNPATTELFNISNATLLDRRVKEERENSVLGLSKKIIDGNDGVIFGESTWNLHPTLPMHNIKQGASKISLISQVPIIPTIFEYIEEPGIFDSENKLYKKCLIVFGKPIMINLDENLITQTNTIKEEMEKIRKSIWDSYNIKKSSIDDIDPNEYINHTYLKKFKALGFTYDSRKEQEFLLFLENELKANEYTLDENGDLVPGITEKDSKIIK